MLIIEYVFCLIFRNTPLHLIFSIFSKDVFAAEEICTILLKNGANPNCVNKDNWSPLHLAVLKFHAIVIII